jgi:hypothetical protein
VPDVAIVPDTKDWTWVLGKRCPECGMTAEDVRLADVAPRVRQSVARWRAVLARADVRDRPDESSWSPLEYACHVRDVCHLFDERLVLMLEHDEPSFANWDQDATAVEERYDQQDPDRVAEELAAEAEAIAARFVAVRPDQAGRSGRRSDGSVFTVATLGQYFLHDLVHHEHDVGATDPTGTTQ